MTVDPDSLLTQVQDLYEANSKNDAIDLLYNFVDVGPYEYMNEVMLAAVERVETLPMSVLISLLTITLLCKDKVMFRDYLFAATMARAVDRTPGRARALLHGLEGSDVDPWSEVT